MRIAIISDIHGNFEALTSALCEIRQFCVDKIICLGDIVGYGASPVECMELAMENIETCVAGNHDWATVGKTQIGFFNAVSRAAIEWTSRKLAPHHIKYLENLSVSFSNGSFHVVHASPNKPHQWHYIMTWNDAKEAFSHLDKQVCFVGHSHIPVIWSEEGRLIRVVFSASETSASFTIGESSKYIINVGSVGQPRDGDPRGCFVIFDTDKKLVSFHRFLYDIISAQNKIFYAGLPSFLAERLGAGI